MEAGKMNIVLVKHNQFSPKRYCFFVPDKFVYVIHKDDKVLCDTSYGTEYGIATTGVISGEGAMDIAKLNGATFPLKEICGVVKIINMNQIKIPAMFKRTIPSGNKISKRIDEFRKYGGFQTNVEIDDHGWLRNGYTAYLVCKMFDLPEIKTFIDFSSH